MMGVRFNPRDGSKTIKVQGRSFTLRAGDLVSAEADAQVETRLDAASKTALLREIGVTFTTRSMQDTTIRTAPLGAKLPPLDFPNLDLTPRVRAVR